ncbi:MAG: sporulation protein YunB [Clostridia bacterium]|nr:sporulation protein YunB [Clostridia bacterium]
MKTSKKRITKRLVAVALALVMLVVLAVVFVDSAIKPAMNAVAQVRVRYHAVAIMNEAIKEVTSSEENIKSVVEVLCNDDGSVRLVQTDSVAMNRLSTMVSQRAQEMLQQLKNIDISIPLGSLVSNGLFSGKGPGINITMIPAGAVNTGFSTEFENAGINQTRHRVYLEVSAQVRIVAPLSGSAMEVTTVVPITEMIIVGDVPDTYINVDSVDSALDLVP